jgi:hypothetical protein
MAGSYFRGAKDLKAFIIYNDNEVSIDALGHCQRSIQNTGSDLQEIKFLGKDPATLFDVKWSWPHRKKLVCERTGLLLTAYRNQDIRKRIACAQSHYLLWEKCLEFNETILILEHDAVFVRKFEPFEFEGGVCSINSPLCATFNDKLYDEKLIEGINEVPWVADEKIPQGLPGNSAYMIKPWAAKELIDLQDSIGWWPNDAIMCKQLCPWLRCHKPYFTEVQGIKSTTSH